MKWHDTLARTWIGLVLTIAALAPAAAQPAPQLSAHWRADGRAAIVAWSNAPAGACVHLTQPDGREIVLAEACGRDQVVELASGGVDRMYAPIGALPGRPGTRYTLRDEYAQRDLATVELAGFTTSFPIVVIR